MKQTLKVTVVTLLKHVVFAIKNPCVLVLNATKQETPVGFLRKTVCDRDEIVSSPSL